MPGTPSPGRWLFLGVLIDVLTEPGAPVTVAQAVLPEGASPPAHLHAALDDSFYILDGQMVIRCGDDAWQAGPGSWVQFPAGVPRTFRVLGGPARVLMVHADDSFLAVVRQIGRAATGTDVPDAIDLCLQTCCNKARQADRNDITPIWRLIWPDALPPGQSMTCSPRPGPRCRTAPRPPRHSKRKSPAPSWWTSAATTSGVMA